MNEAQRSCVVQRAVGAVDLAGEWDGATWGGVDPLAVGAFHPASGSHRPRTQVKVLYDDAGMYHHFRVEDRYVVARHVGRHVPVSKDSCVEFFVSPDESGGYFNFEFNCGGSMLVNYKAPGAERGTHVSDAWLDRMRVATTLPQRVEPEIVEPVTWRLAFFVPWELIEAHAGEIVGRPEGHPGVWWRANWYKCASDSSQPHWAAWSPIGPVKSFHQVDRFGVMTFG